MRRDLDPKVIAHIMDMLAFSLVGMDEIMTRENMPPIEDVIEGIANLMERALVPEDGGNPDAGKAIIRQLAEAARQQFDATHQTQKE